MTKTSFNHDQLIEAGMGTLFEGGGKLPQSPMLMFNRITEMKAAKEGESGIVRAQLDVNPDLWFFKCHFKDDPVMPGCLGLDALWQMLGFYQSWLGRQSKGRAIGVGEVRFRGEVTPETKLVEYGVDVHRMKNVGKGSLAFGDGWVKADGKEIYTMKLLQVAILPSS